MIEDTLTGAPQWQGVESPESCIVERERGWWVGGWGVEGGVCVWGGRRPKEGLVSNLIS